MCYTSINNKNHDHHHQKRSNGKINKKAKQNKHREHFLLLKVTSNTVLVFNVHLVSAEVCELVCYLLLG